jgi:hypothetical protein
VRNVLIRKQYYIPIKDAAPVARGCYVYGEKSVIGGTEVGMSAIQK